MCLIVLVSSDVIKLP